MFRPFPPFPFPLAVVVILREEPFQFRCLSMIRGGRFSFYFLLPSAKLPSSRRRADLRLRDTPERQRRSAHQPFFFFSPAQ